MLADAADPASQTVLGIPYHMPQQSDLLTWCQNMGPGQAAIMLAMGLVYLLWGFQIFKLLVMLNSALVGAYFGVQLGGTGDMAVAGGAVGAIVCAAISWPLMKYAVALMGGLYGALLGASLWHVFKLDPRFFWAGGVIGLAFFGLLSFILFRGSVMLFTSLQGAAMLVFGLLGLLFKYKEIGPTMTTHMTGKPFLLTALILVPAIIGTIYQQHQTAPPAKK